MHVVIIRLQTKSLSALVKKSSPSCYLPIRSLISSVLNNMPSSKIKVQKAVAATTAETSTTTTASSRTREVKSEGKGKVDQFDYSDLNDVNDNKRARDASPEASKLINSNINSSSRNGNKISADTIVKTESGSMDSLKKKHKIAHNITPLSSSSPFTSLPFATSSSTSSVLDSDEVQFISGLTWVDLHISPLQLRPDVTLATGQCFNWKMIEKSSISGGTRNIWIGVLDDIPLAICQTSISTLFALLSLNVKSSDIESVTAKLYDYFQVEHDLNRLYSLWSAQCPRMKEVAMLVAGLRVVRQNPWECLISFLCSSNNNIKRITQMLDNLRKTYGVYICTLTISEDGISWKMTTDGAHNSNRSNSNSNSNSSSNSGSSRDIHLYSFPTVEELSRTSEEELRAMGFGYRASFITKTIEEMLKKTPTPMQWLYNLRDHGKRNAQLSQAEVRNFVQSELLSFHGIGRKVADCIAVFSLDQDGVVPVDTHVWDICVRDYAPQLESSKSLTDRIYNEVGDIFRDRFVEKAGWAHSVLFAAELPEIKGLLSEKTQLEMKLFSESRKIKKIAIKNEKKIKEEGMVKVTKVAKVTKGGKK